MEKIVKQYKNSIFAGLSLFSVLFAVLVLVGVVSLPSFAEADSITVSATISEWITFAVGTTTMNLGTLVNGSGVPALGGASTTLTLGSNSGDGFSVSIQGANGGLASSTFKIATPAAGATTTCNATDPGTDAYGAQVTSTTMTAQTIYNGGGQIVGSVASTSAQKILTSGYSTSSNSATLSVRASANKYDAPGVYSDTLTLTAAANP